jgi:aldose sugar dehydrogenase
MRYLKLSFVISIVYFLMINQARVHAQINIGETIVDTSTIITGLDTPWEILWGTDNHIWITERQGKISRLNPATGEHKNLLTITGVHEQSESGLLGMALHPDFPDSSYLYVVYNYFTNSIRERLVRYTYTGETLTSPIILLDNLQGAPNHNGSRIVIDRNYKLFMTTGDAQNAALSQNLSSLLGKVLRINLDGSVPDDNPIAGSYIWTWGHRNPQGLLIAPDGKIYSSEHGPNSDDEINLIEKGRNYGWPDVNGFCNTTAEISFCTANNVKEPLFAWTPTLAVAGIAYYTHDAIPQWKNTILMSSLKASRMESLSMSPDGLQVTGTSTWFQNWFGRLRDVCVSPDGRVFLAVSNKDGRGSPKAIDDRIVQIRAVPSNGLDSNKTEATIKIYPNPLYSQGMLTINSEKFVNGELMVYDIAGNLIYRDVFPGTEYTLSRPDFKPGYYIVRIKKGTEFEDAPLIVLE